MVFYADIFYLGVVFIQKWVVLHKSFLVTILACKDKLYNHWDVSVSKLQGIWRQTHQFSFRGASSPFSLLNSAELRLGHGWEHKYFARKGLCYFEPCVTVIKDSLWLYFSYFSVVHQDHSLSFHPCFHAQLPSPQTPSVVSSSTTLPVPLPGLIWLHWYIKINECTVMAEGRAGYVTQIL